MSNEDQGRKLKKAPWDHYGPFSDTQGRYRLVLLGLRTEGLKSQTSRARVGLEVKLPNSKSLSSRGGDCPFLESADKAGVDGLA